MSPEQRCRVLLEKVVCRFRQKTLSCKLPGLFASERSVLGILLVSYKNYFCESAKCFQNHSKKKLSRLSALDDDGVYNIPAYLIAQLGKNFQAGLNDTISGNELLSLAMEQILLMQHSVGGVLCVLECENNEKLLNFYCTQNHFVEFGTRKTKSSDKNLLQLLKTI